MTAAGDRPASVDLDALVRPDRLGPLLVETVNDRRWRTFTATLIAGGKSNLTFELVSPAGRLILRRPPSGELLPSAHDMGREARVQRALRGSPVPVPEVVLAHSSAEVLGVPFYVMRKVPGHVVRDVMPPGYAAAPGERAAMADALVDVLASLHKIAPDAVGLDGFGRPHGFLARQVRRWRGQWDASRTHEVPAVDELARRLESRLPPSPRVSVVHGDFRLDNCIMDPADPGRVAAVLDWELSTLGDPLSDLGLLLFYWREPGEAQSPLTPTVTALSGFPDRAHLVERYARQSGLDTTDVDTYRAFAHFKFAVITQGIAARVAAGSMAGQSFGDLDEAVALTAEQGLDLLR